MVRSLYTSADMEKDISITSDIVDRFSQSKSNFGVVFQGKSNSEIQQVSIVSQSSKSQSNKSVQ